MTPKNLLVPGWAMMTIMAVMAVMAVFAGPLACGDATSDPAATTSSGGSSDASGVDGTASDTGEDSDDEFDPSDLFADLQVAPLPGVATVLVVTWTQRIASDSTRVEFSFEDGERLLSPATARSPGMQREVMLGVPEGLEVTFRLVSTLASRTFESATRIVTNGLAPEDLPRPAITAHKPDLTTDARWMMGAVSEKGEGGYGGPNWIYIVDRKGRVVWYFRPAGGENGRLTQGFWPRVARDGTHVTIDQQIRGDAGDLLFTTLDFEYQRNIDLPGQGDCYDVTDEGYILYETRDVLMEAAPTGELREIWKCPWERCYSNTVNWDPASDSVLLSLPRYNTVVQIKRSTGELMRTFGDDGDWSFDPPEYGLDYNHWAHITAQGTFMVSSHLPGTDTHLFMEYEIDDASKTLREVWSYGKDSSDWPEERGMAMKIADGQGNVLGNYGPTGVIVEVTTHGEEAWRVEFGDHLLSNNILLSDLYKLNRGPAQWRAPKVQP